MDLQHLRQRGWLRFSHDPALKSWVEAAKPVADRISKEPDLLAQWLRCDGTWFAGVNAMPNDRNAALPEQGVPELSGKAIDFIRDALGWSPFEWDRAQISICYPGYPRQSDDESDAVFRFRRDRDAAHVDGLRRSDPGRRRSLAETHAFILGIPLNPADEGAAPLVVYEGSHEIIRRAFKARLAHVPPERWIDEDVTDAYVAARREVFETCNRITITAQPGEAYLVHRLALHGVSPWTASEDVPDGRMIAYFRPDPKPGDSPAWWLNAP